MKIPKARPFFIMIIVTILTQTIYPPITMAADEAKIEESSSSSLKTVTSLKPDILISIPFAVKPDVKITMPFLPERDLSIAGEGYPTAFKFDGKGRLHLLIPGINTILVFDSKSKYEKSVKLRGTSGETLPKEAFLYDMAIEKSGTYLILDQSGGWITRFSEKGDAITSFGHIVHGSSMYLADNGQLIVADAALSLLDIFNNADIFTGDVKGPNTFPEVSSKGQLIRSRTMSFNKSLLWLRHIDEATPRLLTVISAEHDEAKLYEATPIGFDSKNRICLITTEKTPDKTYYSYIQYIHEDGTRLEKYLVAPNMERVMDMPRTWSLEKDDRIITFRTIHNQYQILAYSPTKID
jgi:hypothetical protein